jgi:hypothetical protein
MISKIMAETSMRTNMLAASCNVVPRLIHQTNHMYACCQLLLRVLLAVVPPGHKFVNDTVVLCDPAAGEYYPYWRNDTDVGVDECKKCGLVSLGLVIKSDPVEPLTVFTLDTDGWTPIPSIIKVQRTSASCCKCRSLC